MSGVPGPRYEPVRVEYAGVEFRSYFESRVALLLNLTRFGWDYEPYHFQLADDIQYLVDFHVPALNLFVEPRGWRHEVGERQIELFSELIMSGRLAPDLGQRPPARIVRMHDGSWSMRPLYAEVCDYLVLRPDGATFYEFGRIASDALLARCRACRRLFFLGADGSSRCRSCGAMGGTSHFDAIWRLGYNEEEHDLGIGGRSLREWLGQWVRMKHLPER
jgi:hypothetical protein